MGTRAIVRFEKDGKEFACLYRQFDGYPSALGKDIAEALKGRVLVNGFNDHATQCNGMGCLAAMVIAALKEGTGNVYLEPAGTRDVGEEFVYTLKAGEETQRVTGTKRVETFHPILIRVQYGDGTTIYDGPLADFDPQAVQEAMQTEV